MNSPNQLKQDALAIWQAGVDAVDAQRLVRERVVVSDGTLDIAGMKFSLAEIDRVIVVGAGKASGWMAAGFEDAVGADFLRSKNVSGWINVPDDQVINLDSIKVVGCRPAGENLPGPRVLSGTEKILDIVRSASPRDLVLFMIAGGGSALLEQPVAPVTLEDFRTVTMLLSQGGANIHQLNTVRRAISQVKAGGLASATNAGNLVALIVSDVIGDPLDVIASGPTVIDHGHEQNALDVLLEFDPKLSTCPASVRKVLQRPAPKTESVPPNCRVHNFVIGNNEVAVAAAKTKAIELGYQIDRAETDGRHDDAADVGQELADRLLALSSEDGRHCLIEGGEPTVKLCEQPGQGGRNQHLLLAAAEKLVDSHANDVDKQAACGYGLGKFCIVSAGTDGEDGNVPVAGAWFDSALARQVVSNDGIEAIRAALARHDSFRIWNALGSLIRVPPTRTNVCDLRIAVADSRK